MFIKNWNYTVIGDIDPGFVTESIGEFLPRCMVFEDDPDGQWFVQTNSTYGKYPLPANNYAITIFRRDDPRFSITNAVGLAYTGKATIGWIPTESKEILGLRIWHEVIHASGSDSDQMVKKDHIAFGNWLAEYYPGIANEFITNCAAHEHDPFYQKYYYRYLTILLNPLCGKKSEFDFEAAPRSGVAPLSIQYRMIGIPTTWIWKFAGGEVVGAPPNKTIDPTVIYKIPGSYAVELMVSDLFDAFVIRKEEYITVREPSINPLQRLIDFFRRLFGG